MQLSRVLSMGAIALMFIFASCQEREAEKVMADAASLEKSFAVKSVEIFDEVSNYYAKEDVNLRIFTNKNGNEVAEYTLTGESLFNAQLGAALFKEEATEDGTTCSSAYACGKELKKCLDKGMKGVIENGACASYCVTCE